MNSWPSARVWRAGLSLVLAVGLVWAVACGRRQSTGSGTADEGAAAADSANKNAIILRVGSSYYFNADFDTYLKRILGNSPDRLTPESLSRLYDRFVDDKLLMEAAQRQGISLTDEEKSRYQAKIKEQLDPEKSQTLTPAQMEGLNDELLIEKYTFAVTKGLTVSDAEIREYYFAHKSEFLQPERVRVSQILVKTEAQAIDVLARVKNLPQEGFRSVAREESIGPEKGKSGDMGVFGPGELPFEIEKVILSLKEGETSQIVQSSYGYHIFRLDKRFPPEVLSVEQAASSIRSRLLDQKISRAKAAHLNELRSTLDWTASPQNLSFAYQRNAV